MNSAVASSVAFVLALLIWSLTKNSKKPFISDRNQNLEKLNVIAPPSTLVSQAKSSKGIEVTSVPKNDLDDWQSPRNPQERINLKNHLLKLIQGNPDERLKAINIAQRWGHTTVIPILRRGLKDSDSRVMSTSAAAITKFRGSVNQKSQEAETLRPPRNVALMR